MPPMLQGLNTLFQLQGLGGNRAQSMAGIGSVEQPQGLIPPSPPVDIAGAFAQGKAAAEYAKGGRVRGYADGGEIEFEGDATGVSGISPALLELTKRMMSAEDAPLSREDKGLALAQAGFSIASGPSPDALSNIAAGASAGIEALQKLKQQRALQRMRQEQVYGNLMLRDAHLQQQSAALKARQEYQEWLKQNGIEDNARAREAFEETVRHNKAMETNAAAGRDADIQQTDPIQLDDGTIVLPRFNKGKGEYEYKDPKTGKWIDVAAGARRVPPSLGSSLNRPQFEKLENNFLAETEGLRKMDAYLGTVGNAEQGWKLAADKFTASVKTLLDKGELTPEEFATAQGQAKLQGLLGSNRIEVVGPGAMTEYDAGRVLAALGGDVNAWRNKDVVADVMKSLYNEKRRRAAQFRDQLIFSAGTYGKKAEDYVIPEAVNLGAKKEPPPAGKSESDLMGKWLPK